MKKSIVYSSVTGNTELLAKTIQDEIGETIYFGKPSNSALEADLIFIGFWAQAFSCSKDIQAFIETIQDKKVFIFGTAGYGSSQEFLEPIMQSVINQLSETNEIVGSFICQGKVSESKQQAIKDMDATKYNNMKTEMTKNAVQILSHLISFG